MKPITAAPSSRHHAFVVGINSYTDAHDDGLRPLRLAVRDAEAMAEVLAVGGHNVTLVRDAGRGDIVDRMADFSSVVPVGGTVVVFFAGHGACVDGVNFILPVDARRVGEFPGWYTDCVMR